MDMSLLLDRMLVFFVLIILGYVFARKGLVGPEFSAAASKLTLNVFLPATILNSVLGDAPQISGSQLAGAMLVLTVGIAVPYILAFVTTKALPFEKSKKNVLEMLLATSNTMLVGLPVAQTVFGEAAVFYAAMSCIPFNIIIYSYGVWRIRGGEGAAFRFRDVLSTALVATVIALIIFVFKLPVPRPVKELASSLAPANMPVSMLVVGTSLGRVSIADTFREKRVYLVSLFRLLVYPLITWPIICLLTADPVLRGTTMILTASPSAILVTIFAIQYGKDYELGSKGILMTTALSLVTLPLLCMLLL